MFNKNKVTVKENNKRYILVRDDSERVEKEISEVIAKMEGKDLELKARKPVRRYGKNYIMVDFQKTAPKEEVAE